MGSRSDIRRALATLLLLSVLTGCATAPPPSKSVSYRGAFVTYPSGMRLLVHEDPTATEVTLHVSYRVGTADEPQGKEGLANLSWLLTQFSRPGGSQAPILMQQVKNLGIDIKKVLTQDETAFSFTGPPKRFSQMVDLAAQRMKQPLANLTPEDFVAIRDEMAKTLGKRQKTDLDEFRVRWIPELLLVGHPYGRPERGSPESIQRLTLEDVRDFLHAYNTPAHAVVVVTGPLSSVDVKFELARGFLGLTGGERAEKTPPVEHRPPSFPAPPPQGASPVVIPGPVTHPRLWMVWTVPGVYSGKEYQAAMTAGSLRALLLVEFSGDKRVRRFPTDPLLVEWHGATLLIATVELWKQEDAAAVIDTVRQGLRRVKQWQFITDSHSIRINAAYQALRQTAQQLPVNAVVGHLRATGRPDYLRSREQRIAKDLSDNSMDDYLSTYLRPEHLRSMLVVPDKGVPDKTPGLMKADLTP